MVVCALCVLVLLNQFSYLVYRVFWIYDCLKVSILLSYKSVYNLQQNMGVYYLSKIKLN